MMKKIYLKIIKKNAMNIKDLPQIWTSATRKLIRNKKNAMSRMLESCKEKCWRKVAKNHTTDWKQQHTKKMLKMTMEIHNQHEKQQHLQVM
jgi:acetylglutamate kinase